MIDWQDKIQRTSLVDALSGERIVAGSLLYSALIMTESGFQRLDYSSESWQQVDHSHYLTWWRHQLPPPAQANEQSTLDMEALLQIFQDLQDSRVRAQQCLAYCLALLLMRLKKLKLLGLERDSDQAWLVYEQHADQSHYRLRDPQMSEAEAVRVQDDLMGLIGY